MKNIDFKKLLVFIVIIAVAVLAVVGAVKLFKNIGGPSDAESEAIESSIKNYFYQSTIGYNTIYDGIDELYTKDSIETKDLYYGSMIEVAINYASENGITVTKEDEEDTKFIKDITRTEGTSYDAAKIREIVKKLYDIDLPEESLESDGTFLYSYYYFSEADTYVRISAQNVTSIVDIGASMDTYVVKNKNSKGNVVSTVAVAYVYYINGKYTYASDKDGNNVIAEGLSEKKFPEDKIDEFDKYEFTTKKVDNHYVLVSISKAK